MDTADGKNDGSVKGDRYFNCAAKHGIFAKKTIVLPAPTLTVGAKVSVNDSRGTVAHLGPTQFAPGEWVGVILEAATGKNNGAIKGVKYFKCAGKKLQVSLSSIYLLISSPVFSQFWYFLPARSSYFAG